MTIHTTIINPHGQAGIKNPAIATGHIVPGFTQVPGNPAINYRSCPRPSTIDAYSNRFTTAVDVCFLPGYLDSQAAHLVVTGRANPADPMDSRGGQAWGGAILGELYGAGKVYSERRRYAGNLQEWGANGAVPWGAGYNDPAKLHGTAAGSNAVVPYKWYRVVVDNIKHGGKRLLAVRIYAVNDELNNRLGALLYSSTDMVCPEAEHADTDCVLIANVVGNAANLIIGRVAQYWSNSTEWVANP